VTVHAEDALGCSRITKILNLPLAISAFETVGAECLITGEDGKILNLITAAAATVCTIIAD
jgi:hypothetical protein